MSSEAANLKAPGCDNTARRRLAILLVDDGRNTHLMTKWFLGSFGYIVEVVRSAEEALAVFDPSIHDLVITNNAMPGMTGVEMAHIVKLRAPKTPVLMYSGTVAALPSCVDAMLRRPTHLLKLKQAVEELLRHTGG
jgi:DNA-binding response OmpR family regulator